MIRMLRAVVRGPRLANGRVASACRSHGPQRHACAAWREETRPAFNDRFRSNGAEAYASAMGSLTVRQDYHWAQWVVVLAE